MNHIQRLGIIACSCFILSFCLTNLGSPLPLTMILSAIVATILNVKLSDI